MRALALLALVAALVAAPADAAPHAGAVVPGRSFGGLRLGATAAEIRAAWGTAYGRCVRCARETWYFNEQRFRAQGVAVELRGGRAAAFFTIWAPDGWHTDRFLLVGDEETRVAGLYGSLQRVDCRGYAAYLIPHGAAETAIYVLGGQVYGFGLSRAGAPACR